MPSCAAWGKTDSLSSVWVKKTCSPLGSGDRQAAGELRLELRLGHPLRLRVRRNRLRVGQEGRRKVRKDLSDRADRFAQPGKERHQLQ